MNVFSGVDLIFLNSRRQRIHLPPRIYYKLRRNNSSRCSRTPKIDCIKLNFKAISGTVTRGLVIIWQQYFSKTLEDTFQAKKDGKYAFSLRRFAKDLSISPGLLSELISLKRTISFSKALEIATAANFPIHELEKLNKLHEIELKKQPNLQLPEHSIDLILNPLYYKVLCAIEILTTSATPSSIAGLLEISEAELSPIIGRLAGLDILRTEGPVVSWSGQYLTTTEDIPSESIRNYFRSSLTSTVDALKLPVDQREFSSSTFVGSMTEISFAKKMIRKFTDDLPYSMKGTNPDQIFELSIQLRPVSKQNIEASRDFN